MMHTIFKKLISLVLALLMVITMVPVFTLTARAAEILEATFEFGENGDASHYESTTAMKGGKEYTNNNYTLTINSPVRVYGDSRDAKGNSALKLGSNKAGGSFSFTVPEKISKVVINVAGYRTKTVGINVNGTTATISTFSDNGEYTPIEVDTSSQKTVTFKTTTNNRAMIDSIMFYGDSSSSSTCEHTNTETVAEVPATCTEDGYTAGVYCNDCKTYISGHEVIEALGHDWSEWEETTAPGCETVGEQTHTCSRCNATETEDIPATGHNYVDDVCTVCGKVAEKFELVTDVSSLKAGDTIIIVASGYDVALSTTQKDSNRDQASIEKLADGTIKPGTDVQRIKLEAGTIDGTFAFNVGDGYLYAASSSSNILKTRDQKDDDASWIITIGTNGVATVKAKGTNTRNWLRYNYNNGSGLFSCYSSGQADISIYKQSCLHANTTDVPEEPATCTEDGRAAGKFCNDCNTYFEGGAVIPALGHDWSEWEVTTAPGCETAGEQTRSCTREDCNCTETEEIPATGHNYVADGDTYTCSNCGDSYTPVVERYYIAAKRGTTNKYYYMTNELNTNANGVERYQEFDSNLTALPEKITDPVVGMVFVFEKNIDGTYCIYSADESMGEKKYLGHTDLDGNKGNTGTFVEKDKALKININVTDGIYYIYHTCTLDDGTTVERCLALNNTEANEFFAWYSSTTSETKNLVLIPVNPIVQWNITLEDNLKVNFYMDLHEGDQVHITVGTKEITYNLSDLTKSDEGYYVATVSMAAAQMMDEIDVQVINGESVLADKTYTIRQYADIILNGSYPDATKAMVNEMLNYGGMAQVFFGYNTENLANKGITGVGKIDVPNDDNNKMTHTDPDDKCITFYGASLVYRDKIAVRYYFDVTNAEGLKFTADGKVCEPVMIGGHYVIEVPDICPQDYDTQIRVIVTNAEGHSATVSYGPMNYIVRMYHKEGATTEMQNLLQALYNYHLAAKAYIAAQNA